MALPWMSLLPPATLLYSGIFVVTCLITASSCTGAWWIIRIGLIARRKVVPDQELNQYIWRAGRRMNTASLKWNSLILYQWLWELNDYLLMTSRREFVKVHYNERVRSVGVTLLSVHFSHLPHLNSEKIHWENYELMCVKRSVYRAPVEA